MTTHLEIETLSNDNRKSLFRSQRIKINGKEAVTPLKALDPTKLSPKISLNSKTFGLNEIYKGLTQIKYLCCKMIHLNMINFQKTLLNLTNKGQPNDLNICFVNFSSKKSNPFPYKKEIEFLTDVAHSFSDITPIPIIDAKIDNTNFSKYLKYLQLCYDTINELNNKPIIGIIPNIPRELYPKLLEFYLGNEISSFCFDFNGQTPNHLKLRPVMRYLNNKKILDKTLIYGINAASGKALKNTNTIPSKDFISYGFGLDILGEKHTGIRLPKAFFEKMTKAVKEQQKNKRRIFIKSDYGYYQTSAKEEISDLYPNDTKIKLDDIFHDTRKNLQKLFNVEQQSIETHNIKKILNSLDKNETILDYLRGKDQIQKEFKHLQSSRSAISQQTL